MKQYILSIDQGTSSSRAIIFDRQTNIIAKDQHELKQYYPEPGYVEQDPNEICQTQFTTVFNVIKKAKISFSDIATIGITNQRETTILWDKRTGIPVYNAIVWQDKRTAAYCDQLITKGYQEMILKKTGLVIDAYFSASKIKWILENVSGIKSKAKKGEILFGTVDTWLVWNLTNGKLHITDVSNASRTMLFNIHTLSWDKELLALFGIPESILPKVRSSSEIYGETDEKIFDQKIPISGIAGDQQAALFGQQCFEKGMAKNTYGTGCFILMNTGEKPVLSKNGLISTIAWQIEGKTTYALEGSVFIAGAAIKWLRDALKLVTSADETESIAQSLENSGQIFVIPAFSGLGAPYWNQEARGAILGITQGTTDKHIIRATLESIAYQSCDVIKAMESDSKIILKELRVDGGASANNFLMQFQSDILQKNVIRPENIESTALGAALLAGLALGKWDMNKLNEIITYNRIFKNNISNQKASELYNKWKNAIQQIM